MGMRVIFGLTLMLGIMPAMAQTNEPKSPEEVVKQTQEAFSKTKDAKGIESIKEWCKLGIESFSFPERDRLMVQALQYMEANKLDEANANLKRVNSLEEMDANLSTMVCKPM